jgi:uncharacterized membrane-anchored protein
MTQTEQLNKVARITIFFWILKVLATTLGETLGDMLSMTWDIGYTVSLIITLGFFGVVLFSQLKVNRFIPGLYWLVIIATTTLGTEISDFMDRTLGFGYAWGSLLLFSGLITVLWIWHQKEKGIRIYPVTDRNIELYYWLAILLSNSLGTAFGDYLSDNLGFSYLAGAGVTALIIAVVVSLHYFSRLNQILLFWIAFIFTRPFGATFGDLLTKPLAKGGLDLGTVQASLVTAALFVIILTISLRNKPVLAADQQEA